MKTILASDPQIPVNRVFDTHQPSRMTVGFSSSSNRMGGLDSPTSRWFDSSGGVQRSGLTPYKRPCITFLLRADALVCRSVHRMCLVPSCSGEVGDGSSQADHGAAGVVADGADDDQQHVEGHP